MHKRIKYAAISLLLFCHTSSALADNEVTVSASSELRIPSSQVIVSITLQETAASSSDAVTALQTQRTLLQQKIVEQQVPAANIFVRGQGISRGGQKDSSSGSYLKKTSTPGVDPNQVVLGVAVEASEVLGITLDSLPQAAKIGDLALASGAHAVSFEVRALPNAVATERAVVEATKAAEVKATKVAEQLGVRLGDAVSVEILETAPGAVLRREMHLDASSDTITELRREVHVTARFQLLKK